jgi:CubicO group peptidase (beta-lactamase class C family)
LFAALCAVVLLSLGIAGICFESRDDYPKKSPFAAVRWQEAKPEIQVGGEWFKLVSLNDLPVAEILAFSQRTYREKWQKRFEEDLVELLTRMGHPPQDNVKLVVQSLTTHETRTLEDVPMTRANRQAIWNAAQARGGVEQQPGARNGAATDGAKVSLADLIPALRKEKKLVGLAAMIVVDGKVVDSAVDGERKKGSGVRLEIGDRWHLGSITKSVTATMIARLIESGKMQWSTTVGECFPDAPIHHDWKPVTLKQLLTHTSGAPANFSLGVRLKQPALGPERTRARRVAVLEVLAEKPENPPGKKYAYSNVGYTIAGAMAETKTGATWEDLVKREVFEPLALTAAGFGPPKSSDEKLEQPRGHTTNFLGWKTAAGDDADNTPIMGPAGIVHMTLKDLCTYATEHLRGERGDGKLLSAETYKLLHTPELDDYACGWVRNDPSADIPHTVYWHNGSNTMWYALVVFIPAKNMVIAVTSNDGDIENAEAAAWDVVNASAKEGKVKADPIGNQQPGSRPAVPIEDGALFRTRIDEFLNAARTMAGFSGAVLVARGGKPVYERALGFSHLESKAPNTLDTPFRIASLSKQFTAAAIFRLEAQGKLDIDDPVHKYLSEFGEEPYRDITIHHLLTHTSGLPRIATGWFGPLRWDNMSKAATPVDDYVRLAVKQKLEFEPGTDYEYSNFGFRCLAALIARVTGREYADFMDQEVFQPLGMKNSGVARVTRPQSESRVAKGLTFRKLDSTGEPLYANGEGGRNYGAGYGSGGIYTSANDLLRWDRALAGDEFLSKSQKKRLFQPIHDYYACGWIVKKSGLDGRLYQTHTGGNEGFFSQMMRLPDDDLVIIALGNVDGTDALDEIRDQLFRLCRSLPYRDPD